MLRDYLICVRIWDSNSFVRWRKGLIIMMRFLATFCFFEGTPVDFSPRHYLSHIRQGIVYIAAIVTIHLLNWLHIRHKIAINRTKIRSFHALKPIEWETHRFIHDHKKIENNDWHNRSIDKWHRYNRICHAQRRRRRDDFFGVHKKNKSGAILWKKKYDANEWYKYVSCKSSNLMSSELCSNTISRIVSHIQGFLFVVLLFLRALSDSLRTNQPISRDPQFLGFRDPSAFLW